jgi:hypothetical protein
MKSKIDIFDKYSKRRVDKIQNLVLNYFKRERNKDRPFKKTFDKIIEVGNAIESNELAEIRNISSHGTYLFENRRNYYSIDQINSIIKNELKIHFSKNITKDYEIFVMKLAEHFVLNKYNRIVYNNYNIIELIYTTKSWKYFDLTKFSDQNRLLIIEEKLRVKKYGAAKPFSHISVETVPKKLKSLDTVEKVINSDIKKLDYLDVLFIWHHLYKFKWEIPLSELSRLIAITTKFPTDYKVFKDPIQNSKTYNAIVNAKKDRGNVALGLYIDDLVKKLSPKHLSKIIQNLRSLKISSK